MKVLPARVADRPEMRERFEREARAVSSLNHPHICALYDIGRQDGIDFLVMEYLEGETLASRLERGPLPHDQALHIAGQIADALDKAHRKGLTHRDLKLGNIMLTKAGAKLLDFGLAKLRNTPSGTGAALSAMPTQALELTQEGTILGTLQYMSPEQLEGKEVDARADIFAFGVVLYEMLTGHKAFTGKSPASLIAAILEHEPPLISSIRPVAPALDHVVKKCLAKDPEERWQSAQDVAGELAWVTESAAPPAPSFWPLCFSAERLLASARFASSFHRPRMGPGKLMETTHRLFPRTVKHSFSTQWIRTEHRSFGFNHSTR